MTPLCLLAAALAIGVPTALTLLLWAACALAGRIDDEQGYE
jgi:hypothetical protein